MRRNTPEGESYRIVHWLGQVGVAYCDWQPEGGGKFELCFTRVFSPSAGEDWAGAAMDGSYVLVSWVGHGAWAFELFADHPYEETYVGEKLRASRIEAEALTALLNEVQVRASAVLARNRAWQVAQS